MNPLAGKPLRYLIGADNAGRGADDVITEVPYDEPPARRGLSIGYCNLFDEMNTGHYGPYLHDSDTAADYAEGQIDPRGIGWLANLSYQFKKRAHQGFEYIELDNADAYSISDVIGAIELAARHELKVIAKNPWLMDPGAVQYLAHPNIYGAIVEKGAGAPVGMDEIRREAGKPDLPVWFVTFGSSGKAWARECAVLARGVKNMSVTWSRRGEYGSSEDILRPH